MKPVTVEQMQSDLSGVLALVALGETVTITRHDQPIAQVVPANEKPQQPQWPDFAARLNQIYPLGVPPGKAVSEIIGKGREERF